MSLPLKAVPLTLPVPVVTLADPPVTGLVKLRTIVWFPGAPPLRSSTPEVPVIGMSISKFPAAPWLFRETALDNASNGLRTFRQTPSPKVPANK